jgi:hypothetical protein
MLGLPGNDVENAGQVKVQSSFEISLLYFATAHIWQRSSPLLPATANHQPRSHKQSSNRFEVSDRVVDPKGHFVHDGPPEQ